jgi:hypothetical protein
VIGAVHPWSLVTVPVQSSMVVQVVLIFHFEVTSCSLLYCWLILAQPPMESAW